MNCFNFCILYFIWWQGQQDNYPKQNYRCHREWLTEGTVVEVSVLWARNKGRCGM